jgi:ABC-2 type transport system ATP-binding protein
LSEIPARLSEIPARLSEINVAGPRGAELFPMDAGRTPEAVEPPIIEVRALTRRFGGFVAVDRVSFSVGRGEVFGLIGANGAGKSTIVRMLTTLLPVSAGGATVAGYDLVRQPGEVRKHIGYVPQLMSADGDLTARENLLLSARLYGIPLREVRARIGDALASMELAPFADRLVKGFSGGMIRRLEIAQGLLHRPAILFLDEPTVGLDPAARHAVLDRLAALGRETRTTILVTSHYMEEIDALCERIGVLRQGALVAVGTPGALKARVGPAATLDDVFTALAGEEAGPGEEEAFRDARLARRAARSHG